MYLDGSKPSMGMAGGMDSGKMKSPSDSTSSGKHFVLFFSKECINFFCMSVLEACLPELF